jgi:Tol biopolymer transport system component
MCRSRIWRVRADGSEASEFYDPGGEGRWIDVSVDGEYLLYARQDGCWSYSYEIYTTPIASPGSPVNGLTSDSIIDVAPRWSSDGSLITWYKDIRPLDGIYEIFIMSSDGSGESMLTDNDWIDQLPFFGYGDSKIVFTSDEDGDGEIYTMNLDGTGVERLTDNDWSDRADDWYE